MPELQRQKRQVAVKSNIRDIVNGKYVKEEGWLPNFIETEDGRKVSRVNLIGTIVFKSDEENFNYKNFIIDDGSGKISVRSFEKNDLSKFDVGNIILVIGRPREFNNEKYIIPEIVKKVSDVKWIQVRKLELNKSEIKIEVEPINNVEKEIVHEEIEENLESSGNVVYELIKRSDKGEGVLVENIIKISKSEDSEKIVNKLLEKGDIFEVKPGIVKVLE